MESYILIAIISMMLFAVNTIILKSAKNIDAVTLTLVSIATAAILILSYWLLFVANKEVNPEGMKLGIMAGAVYAVALTLFVIAIQLGKASTVITINALSAGVAVILAVVFLKENLSIFQVAGVVLGIIAVMLLSL